MKSLEITETKRLPAINFNAETGILSMKGKSLPDNPLGFFGPVMDWLKEYVETPAGATVFHVSLEYFNTSTSKFLMQIFQLLQDLYKKGNDVRICWYYGEDDLDLMESGEEFEGLLNVPFEIIRT